MRSWLAVCGLILSTLALSASASSPVERWSDGDWWELQLEHATMHHGTPRVGWTPSFKLRFNVARGEGEIRVEVATIPENRFKERLVLRYSLTGELLSAQVVEPDRVQDLPPSGGMGVFGMIGRQAFVVGQAPTLPAGSQRLVLVPIDDTGTAQTWGSKDPWWLQYETPQGVPQRATLTDASWRQGAGNGSGGVGNGTVIHQPGDGSLGPGQDATGNGGAGNSGEAPKEPLIPLGPEPGGGLSGGTPLVEPGVTPGGSSAGRPDPGITPVGTTKPGSAKPTKNKKRVWSGLKK